MSTRTKMILAIDVGLKNLSMCIMSKSTESDSSHIKIHLWEVYNILKEENEDATCLGLLKNGKTCGKACKYKHITDNSCVYCCKLHFPKSLPIKKDNIIKAIKIKDISLQDIVKSMIQKIQQIHDEHLELFQQLEKIVIELQPKCNDKMKLLSHIIYGKLVDLLISRVGSGVDIKFIRATQKLSIYDGPEILCDLKDGYAKRKFMSVKYTEYFIEKLCETEERVVWQERLGGLKKKDDMADVFCYCISHLYDKKKVSAKKPSTTRKKNAVSS